MEKNFLSMELICSTKGVQFDKLNNYIIPFKFTNFNSTKKRIFHLLSLARNGDQKRFPRMRGMGRKEKSSEDPRGLDPLIEHRRPDFFAWHVQNLPSRTSGKNGRSSTSDSNHWLRKTILLVERVRVGKQNRSVERFWFCVQPPALSSFHLSLSLPLIFSRSSSNRIDRLRARQWQQLFFADNDFFEISERLSLSLSFSLCLSLCARAFRFPFQQASINGSCQNVTWLAGMGGGREVVAFCGHFAEHRYGKVRKARRDNWRMRILKLGLVFFPLFLSSSFFSPLLCDRAQQR